MESLGDKPQFRMLARFNSCRDQPKRHHSRSKIFKNRDMTRSQSLCSGAEQSHNSATPTDSSAELAHASFEHLIVGQLFNTSSKSIKTNVRYQTLAREESLG